MPQTSEHSGIRWAAFLFTALVTTIYATACGPSAGGGPPYEVTIYDQSDENRYAVVDREIDTLDSINKLTGEVARFRGNGEIHINESNPQTPDEYKNAINIADHKRVLPDFARKNGRIVPMDFHSMVMFSMYHHMERANRFFVSLGMKEGLVGKRPVHYQVKLEIFGISLLTDNAAYSPTEDVFLVPPRFLTKGVPLAANRGIVVHEYSHAVFNRVVQHDQRAPPSITGEWSTSARNRLKAINEGLADIFAGLQTDNPRFISSSISVERFDLDRDLSKERHYTTGIQTDIETTPPARFNPYRLGAVIASTLWSIREGNSNGIDGLTTEVLGKAILDAMRKLGDQLDEDTNTADLFNLIYEELPSNARSSACQIFVSRLDAVRGELTCSQ